VTRTRFNPKRRLANAVDEADRDRWVAGLRYSGNPEHKRNPGDFGLTPPVSPRPDKSCCDDVGVFDTGAALSLLRAGVERDLISERRVNGWPQNIWSMTSDHIPLEAQLENATTGAYHGYPLPENDPFADRIRQAW
jgi:hypothetical protein